METLIGLLILIGTPALIIGGGILLFNWLVKRQTGYDATASIEDTTFNRNAFLRSYDPDRLSDMWQFGDKRKSRKSSATPHYDRLVDMEQAEAAREAQARLEVQDEPAEHDEPVRLAELMERDQSAKQ